MPGTETRPVELLRALAVLGEPPTEAHASVARAAGIPDAPDPAEYTDVLLLQLHPYASVHLGDEGMLGGPVRERVAGFWRAVGRTPPAEPDHLSALVGLYAALLEEAEEAEAKEARATRNGVCEPEHARAAITLQSARALLHEHLAPWVFGVLGRIERGASGFYGTWAQLLTSALDAELDWAGRPGPLPVHLREAADLPDPRTEGGEAFLTGLLAPVRTGMILTRSDLARIAGDLGVGVRIGDRRFVLEHLFGIDRAGVLGALGRLAEATRTEHMGRRPVLGAVARFWEERAAGTARLLECLAAEVATAEAAS